MKPYYSMITPILPVKQLELDRLSCIPKVTSLVINEARTGIQVLLKPKSVLLFITKVNTLSPRAAVQVISGHTTTSFPLSPSQYFTSYHPTTNARYSTHLPFCFSNTVSFSFAFTVPLPAPLHPLIFTWLLAQSSPPQEVLP